jgi:hypothetical protein
VKERRGNPKVIWSQMPEAHSYNPSYLGDWYWEVSGLRLNQVNSS